MSRNSNPTLELTKFWRWLKHHRNCIVQAGGPGFTIFDQPDFFWHLTEEQEGLFVVQVVKGKAPIAELVFNSLEVTFVQASEEEDEQMLFDCMERTPEGHTPMCWFLLAHHFHEDDPEAAESRWTH